MMSGIAGGAEEILVPETPTDIHETVELLRRGRASGKTSSIVVIAEGDEFGKAIDVAKKFAEVSEFKDYRVAVIGHLQRGGTPTAFDRVLASRLGVRAVEALIEGETGKMTGLHAGEVVLRPLSDTWEQRSQFNPDFMRVARILAT
jgi:6-phosphofructokinase 1